jgi:hypothetical protein
MDIIDIEGAEGQKPSDIWRNPTDVAKEIQDKQQPVDYPLILGDNRVLFLAESHSNYPIRKHIAQHAKDLKAAGITHYAIEAYETGNDFFDKLNKGKPVDLSKVDVGPGRADYEEAIRAMAAQGIKVVAVDIDHATNPSREEREARLTENIMRLLQEDPNSKVAVLIGGFHALRYYVSRDVPSVGKRLMDAQAPAVNVYFAGGEDKMPTQLTDPVNKIGLGNREFMLDCRPYANSNSVPFGKGEADYIIHLPQ